MLNTNSNTNESEKLADKSAKHPKSESSELQNSTIRPEMSAGNLNDDLNDDLNDADDDLLDEVESDALEASEAAGENLEAGSELASDLANDIAVDGYSDFDVDSIDNILELKAEQFPRFTLAKNKARFLRMVSDYRSKQEWLDVAPLSGVTKLFKQQTKELVGIRAKKLDYEMEIEMGTLTPVQISHRRDELKMCKVQEKMAVSLISKMQVKIRSGRR